MKGITPIISIIVLLLITVSLAGAAYMFLSGYMTAYTRGVQVSGICVGGTTAYVTVTNMGNFPVDLGACDTTGGDGTVVTLDCGDLTIIRTDGGGMLGIDGANEALFDKASIPASEANQLYKAVFTDPGCTVTGTGEVCKYAFTRAGDSFPTEVSVTCTG